MGTTGTSERQARRNDRPTGCFVVEVVVVLCDVGEDAQLVGYGHVNHVLRVEQVGDAELVPRHVECLQDDGRKHRFSQKVDSSVH